jgi:hypothetical protein
MTWSSLVVSITSHDPQEALDWSIYLAHHSGPVNFGIILAHDAAAQTGSNVKLCCDFRSGGLLPTINEILSCNAALDVHVYGYLSTW